MDTIRLAVFGIPPDGKGGIQVIASIRTDCTKLARVREDRGVENKTNPGGLPLLSIDLSEAAQEYERIEIQLQNPGSGCTWRGRVLMSMALLKCEDELACVREGQRAVERMSYETYMGIYSKVPRFCVDCVVWSNLRREVLLVKRAIEPCKGMWHFPGGTLLYGETVRGATKRILQDEVGLQAEIFRSLGFMEFDENATGHSVSLAVEAKVTGELSLDQEQNSGFGYFDLDELPMPLLREHADFLNMLVHQRRVGRL